MLIKTIRIDTALFRMRKLTKKEIKKIKTECEKNTAFGIKIDFYEACKKFFCNQVIAWKNFYIDGIKMKYSKKNKELIYDKHNHIANEITFAFDEYVKRKQKY